MLLDTLNQQQLAAVRQIDGPLLLLAGAGSGKTRVITTRIAYLVDEVGIAPERILAVTFTNKAAREMKQRVETMAGRKRCKGMIIATFHALCVRVLKEDIERLGYKKNFSIYGAADQIRLIRDLIQSYGTSDGKLDADRILWLISDAKNRLVSPEDYSPRFQDDHGRAATSIYPRYQKALKAFNAVDFDDLLMLTGRLFRDHPEVLAKYQERFRYIMVDEYQDTNAAQYQLLRQLSALHGNLCVVGDDDQSIYGWRGADLGNILGFEKDFPATRLIKLEQNYRSTGNILQAANAVIRKNRHRKAKELWTADGSGTPIDYIQCMDGEDEARMVVERIHGEFFRGKCRYADFAVLFRTNAQSRAFEEQLRYENIPYVLIGGQQFFDRKEVKDVLAYFKVLQNLRDEVNLLRILNFPRRGIGSTTADRLIRLSVERDCSLWEVLKQAAEIEELGGKAGEAIGTFVRLLEKYRRRFGQGRRLGDTANELLDELGMEDELFRTAEDPAKARRRMDNVAEVLNAMASYEEREPAPNLAGFLEKVSLLDRDEPQRNDKENKLKRDAVVLMSLHSSKGLEFPHVFLVGLEEGLLPHKKSAAEGTDIEEERRLCYVGITRARQTLTLLNAARRKKFGKMEPRIPSPFLQEIPPELLRKSASDTPVERSEVEKEKLAADFFAGIRQMLDD